MKIINASYAEMLALLAHPTKTVRNVLAPITCRLDSASNAPTTAPSAPVLIAAKCVFLLLFCLLIKLVSYAAIS